MFSPSNSCDQNGFRTAVMESQFLLDIVKDTFNYEEDPVVDNTSKTWRSESLQPHLQDSSQWNLTILENDPNLPGDKELRGNLKRKNRSKEKTEKKKWKLRNDLPLQSYFQSPEDWNDLFLMSKLSGGKCEPSDEDGDSSPAESDDHDDDDEYHSQQQDNQNTYKYFDPISGSKKHRPVEEMIKRKVIEARQGERLNVGVENKNSENLLSSSFDNIDEIVKPEYVDISEMVDETGKVVAPKIIYNFQKRKFEAEKREVRNARRRVKKRTERLYEKQPFDDPVLEKRRLKAVRAKMIHDKNRFDLENIKMDVKELTDENALLKQQLSQFQEREDSLLKLLEEKKTVESRNIELEKEVNMWRQREGNHHVESNQIKEPNYALVGVQVDGRSLRTAGK